MVGDKRSASEKEHLSHSVCIPAEYARNNFQRTRNLSFASCIIL